MSVNLLPDEELHAALRPYRVDPEAFEAAVRERLETLQSRAASDPFVRLSPLAKAAASFLPLQVLAGCQTPMTTGKAAPAGALSKLVSYLAFPAISLFVLLGATIFSFIRIRSIQGQNAAGLNDQAAIRDSVEQWWRQNRIGAYAVFAVSLMLMVFGASSLLFLFYLVSFGVLLYVLSSFAKIGIGNREMVGKTCGMGLIFLGQAAASSGIGKRELHFLDQNLVGAVFFAGVLLLLPYMHAGRRLMVSEIDKPQPVSRWSWVFYGMFAIVQMGLIAWFWTFHRVSLHHRMLITLILAVGGLMPVAGEFFVRWLRKHRQTSSVNQGAAIFMVILLVPLITWSARSLLWPLTPERVKGYVESFDHARYSSASWRTWEIAAMWAIDARLEPDLSQPRRLLAAELAGEQNPHILSSAMRAGLISRGELEQLQIYDRQRRFLLTNTLGIKPLSVHLEQHDWVVRTAVLKDDLSAAERDQIEEALLTTIEGLSTDQYATLERALRATQLLAIIGRPIDREKYRSHIHELLRSFHVTSASWFQAKGGFKAYKTVRAGDLKATAYAVELMEIFGVPDGLDTLWVRSFLRPGNDKVLDGKWVAAATLARLNSLPDARRPTWFECLYYERTLLAAMALVGLCLYATFSSPARALSVPGNS